LLKENSAAPRRLTEPCQCDAELEFRVTCNAFDFVENAKIMNCSRTGLRLASNSELASFASASSCGLCSKWILPIWQERVPLIHVAEDGLVCSKCQIDIEVKNYDSPFRVTCRLTRDTNHGEEPPFPCHK